MFLLPLDTLAVSGLAQAVADAGEGWGWFDWLAFAANLATLIGLGLTIWALRKALQLRRDYELLLVVPQQHQILVAIKDRLFEHLDTVGGPAPADLRAELQKAVAVLGVLKEKPLPIEQRNRLQSHFDRVRHLVEGRALSHAALWDAHEALLSADEHLADVIRSLTLNR